MLTLFQADAFTREPFHGNPAAVLPLPYWPSALFLQSIAEENNLAETAFLVPTPGGETHTHLRWFTPVAEVDLCGHATLATAAVLWDRLAFPHDEVRFQSRSGLLRVTRTTSGLRMLLPATAPQPVAAPPALASALGVAPLETHAGYDLLALLPSEQAVRSLQPDVALLATLPFRAVVVTARGAQGASPGSGEPATDFVSRCFAPALGIPEDPVTGSAHAQLAPFWAARLGRTTLHARQVSRRGGSLLCEVTPTHVALTGHCAHYMQAALAVALPPPA